MHLLCNSVFIPWLLYDSAEVAVQRCKFQKEIASKYPEGQSPPVPSEVCTSLTTLNEQLKRCSFCEVLQPVP